MLSFAEIVVSIFANQPTCKIILGCYTRFTAICWGKWAYYVTCIKWVILVFFFSNFYFIDSNLLALGSIN